MISKYKGKSLGKRDSETHKRDMSCEKKISTNYKSKLYLHILQRNEKHIEHGISFRATGEISTLIFN